MNEGDVTVREISWRDILPWNIIYRAFGLSISMPILTLASIGLLLTPLGWQAGFSLFLNVDDKVMASERKLDKYQQVYRRWSENKPVTEKDKQKTIAQRAQERIFNFNEYTDSTMWNLHVEPFTQMFRLDLQNEPFPMRLFAFFVVGNLWTLAVWSLFGGAITRIAVVQMGRNERVGMTEAVSFAVKKFGSFFLSPLVPILAIACLCIPAAIMGLFMQADWGVVLIGLVWIFALVGGLLLTILLVGLLFGWPLMWGAISSEIQGDVFEATSRSYSYTYQRPLHYLFYAIIATIVGVLGSTLVLFFAETVLYMTEWGLAWGAGGERMKEILGANQAETYSTGRQIILFFNSLVRVAAEAFNYSFFWCGAAAIYLLLRRNVDHTEFDEVFVEEEVDRFGIPPLDTDEQGVPIIADEPAASADSPSDDEGNAEPKTDGEAKSDNGAGSSESS